MQAGNKHFYRILCPIKIIYLKVNNPSLVVTFCTSLLCSRVEFITSSIPSIVSASFTHRPSSSSHLSLSTITRLSFFCSLSFNLLRLCPQLEHGIGEQVLIPLHPCVCFRRSYEYVSLRLYVNGFIESVTNVRLKHFHFVCLWGGVKDRRCLHTYVTCNIWKTHIIHVCQPGT